MKIDFTVRQIKQRDKKTDRWRHSIPVPLGFIFPVVSGGQ